MFNSKLKNAFPKKYSEEIKVILNKLPLKVCRTQISNTFQVNLNQEEIYIPERIYFKEISKELYDEFTPIQKTIVDCIYTRHKNGFIREKYLYKLLQRGHCHYWVTPYLIKLSGEYVIEILNVLKECIPQLNDTFIRTYLVENKRIYHLTEQRIISYWNCYYREEFPMKDEYIGFQLLHYYRGCLLQNLSNKEKSPY
ncbi:hypothetical protein ACIQ4I_13305 [Rummeliibacillus sp. NPDC094406]|uniref:hypothetical protein n=1 Tax=Rummeliibacillus sp. NPDC094406 TaxID=3364511 RepID=UPI00380E4615